MKKIKFYAVVVILGFSCFSCYDSSLKMDSFMKTLENEAAQYEVQNDEYLTPYQVEQEPIVKDSIQINDNLEKTIKTPTILVKN